MYVGDGDDKRKIIRGKKTHERKISKVDTYIFDSTTIMVSIKTYIILIRSPAMKLIGGCQLNLSMAPWRKKEIGITTKEKKSKS